MKSLGKHKHITKDLSAMMILVSNPLVAFISAECNKKNAVLCA